MPVLVLAENPSDDLLPLQIDANGYLKTILLPVTAGGCSMFRSIDLDESEEAVKASAGQLYGGIILNMSASVRYLKLYDATVANVTVGTTTPDLTIPIPTLGDTNGAGLTLDIPAQGLAFANAITVAATTDLESNGAPGANEIIAALFYK